MKPDPIRRRLLSAASGAAAAGFIGMRAARAAHLPDVNRFSGAAQARIDLHHGGQCRTCGRLIHSGSCAPAARACATTRFS